MTHDDSSPFAEPEVLAKQSFTFYEGWMDDQGQLKTRTGTVTLTSIPQYLRLEDIYSIPNSRTFTLKFRVISFPRYPLGRHKVGFTEDVFRDLKKTFGLHDFTVESFISNNGVFAKFDDFPKKGDTALVLKVPSSKPTGLDALSVTKDAASGCIYAIYYSLHDENYIFSALQAEPERCFHQLFFAGVMYRSHQKQVEKYRKRLDDEIHTIERITKYGYPGGLRGEFHPLGRDVIDTKGREKLNYKQVLERLSYCQTEIAIIGTTARFSENAAKWLVKLLVELKDEQMEKVEYKNSQSSSDKISWNMANRLLHEVEFSQNLAIALLSQLQHLKERVHSQTTLLLSLITQRDSEYNASIAMSSMQDSTAMKTIAVLTTVFLPGTFVATFFSMTMFNWNPTSSGSFSSPGTSDNTPTVSPYLWIYWVIAIPLTLFVMLLWLFWSRVEQRKGQRKLNMRDGNELGDPRKAEHKEKYDWISQ